jgi:hypothetical protein
VAVIAAVAIVGGLLGQKIVLRFKELQGRGVRVAGARRTREQYIRQADHHFTFGVRSVTAIVSRLNAENCQKVYMAAVMICFVYFGRGPRPGEYFIFSEHGPAELVVLIDGVKLILQSHQAKIFSGILEPKSEKVLYEITPAMHIELHEHRVQLIAVQ